MDRNEESLADVLRDFAESGPGGSSGSPVEEEGPSRKRKGEGEDISRKRWRMSRYRYKRASDDFGRDIREDKSSKRWRIDPEYMDYSLLSEGTPEPSEEAIRRNQYGMTFPYSRFVYDASSPASRREQYYRFFKAKYEFYMSFFVPLRPHQLWVLMKRIMPVIHMQAMRKERYMKGPIGLRYKKAVYALLEEKIRFHESRLYVKV